MKNNENASCQYFLYYYFILKYEIMILLNTTELPKFPQHIKNTSNKLQKTIPFELSEGNNHLLTTPSHITHHQHPIPSHKTRNKGNLETTPKPTPATRRRTSEKKPVGLGWVWVGGPPTPVREWWSASEIVCAAEIRASAYESFLEIIDLINLLSAVRPDDAKSY